MRVLDLVRAAAEPEGDYPLYRGWKNLMEKLGKRKITVRVRGQTLVVSWYHEHSNALHYGDTVVVTYPEGKRNEYQYLPGERILHLARTILEHSQVIGTTQERGIKQLLQLILHDAIYRHEQDQARRNLKDRS